MTNKAYQQIAEAISPSDISSTFSGCVVWDRLVGLAARVESCVGSQVILTSIGNRRESYNINNKEFFSDRMEIFPPYEGMVFYNNVCIFISRSPRRSVKKGLYPEFCTLREIGDIPLGHKFMTQRRYSVLAELFNPQYMRIPAAVASIRSTEALSVPVGRLFGVAFCNKADGLALYYKTTPIAKILDGGILTSMTSNVAMLTLAKCENFKDVTWR